LFELIVVCYQLKNLLVYRRDGFLEKRCDPMCGHKIWAAICKIPIQAWNSRVVTDKLHVLQGVIKMEAARFRSDIINLIFYS